MANPSLHLQNIELKNNSILQYMEQKKMQQLDIKKKKKINLNKLNLASHMKEFKKIKQ